MSKSKLVIPAVAIAAMAGAVAGTVALSGGEAIAAGAKEKCYGVAKAGKNDCGNVSGTHGCAGQSATDGAWDEWLYVSKGTCDKLVGGTTDPKKPS
jgi:uncharacterized membrane protein